MTARALGAVPGRDKPRSVSNRVRCQAILGFQGKLDLRIAFMMLRSLRMQATITTFAGFPGRRRLCGGPVVGLSDHDRRPGFDGRLHGTAVGFCGPPLHSQHGRRQRRDLLSMRPSWYTQAYGNSGVIYTPVPPPAGY